MFLNRIKPIFLQWGNNVKCCDFSQAPLHVVPSLEHYPGKLPGIQYV